MAIFDEVTDSLSITRKVARGETLVRHVEEGEKLLLLDNVGDLLPLLWRGANTSGVEGAGVEQNNGLLRNVLIRVSKYDVTTYNSINV